MADDSLEGSDDDDSDPGDSYNPISTEPSITDTTNGSYQIQIKYNSIYHNAGQ